MRRENSFRLHYFPEIPLDDPPVRRPSGGADFRRLDEGAAGRRSPVAGGAAREQVRAASSPPTEESRAYREGLHRGQQEGYAAVCQRASELFRNLAAAIEEVDELQQRVLREAETAIVEMALAVARKVIQREVRIDRSCIAEVIQEALQKTDPRDRVVIRMNSADLQYLETACVSLPESENRLERLRLEADDSIAEGGCMLETKCGDIDGRIEQRLQIIESALRAKLPDLHAAADETDPQF